MHQRLAGWWEATSLRTKITGVTVVVITLSLFGIGIGTINGCAELSAGRSRSKD
jgi:two-component system, OmpR family, sensor kinase